MVQEAPAFVTSLAEVMRHIDGTGQNEAAFRDLA